MNTPVIFENIFKRFASDCYIIESDLNTQCTNKSENCPICAGTGNVIKKVYKVKSLIDIAQSGRTIMSSGQKITTGNYYSDGRVGYFLKDCNFNLSPNINRVVLNIVNGDVDSVFSVQYLEPVIERNQIVHYLAALSKKNINSSKQLEVYKSILKERKL